MNPDLQTRLLAWEFRKSAGRKVTRFAPGRKLWTRPHLKLQARVAGLAIGNPCRGAKCGAAWHAPCDWRIAPYYRLAQSEGESRFAGYASERFRDRQLMLVRIEYRWTIFHRMSALALYELSEVAPRTESFSLRGAHKSYGGGLRLGQSDEAVLRFELAKSVEQFHAVLALGSDF